jgi:hypothetical protein
MTKKLLFIEFEGIIDSITVKRTELQKQISDNQQEFNETNPEDIYESPSELNPIGGAIRKTKSVVNARRRSKSMPRLARTKSASRAKYEEIEINEHNVRLIFKN